MFDKMFDNVMGKIENGCCRLGMNGRIAIKTSDGYKTYNPATGSLTNCSSFVLDVADDFFFVMPTRKLAPGDIVFINGRPVYVLGTKQNNRVEVMDYEDSSIKTVIPERHVVMGRKFYGKIVSLMCKGFSGKGGFFKNMLKFKMMSSLLGGDDGASGMFGCGNAMTMMMLMGNGGMENLFDGVFDGVCDDEDDASGVFDMFGGDEDCDDEEDAAAAAKPEKA